MRKLKIGIVDYDAGNTESVANALRVLGYDLIISCDQVQLLRCDFLILPGVGAFASAFQNLQKYHLVDFLNEWALVKSKPVFGICVGMQLFAQSSTEGGGSVGLGWLDQAKVDRIQTNQPLPHVGWNTLEHSGTGIFARTPAEECFYFDHSYVMECSPDHSIAQFQYGEIKGTAAVQKGSIIGVQFHPEKSQNAGLKLLRSAILEHGRNYA